MANWLSTKSVAEKYGIPKEQIREWIRLRYLTCSSIGTEPYEDNDPLIDTDELDKALEFNSLKSYPDDTMMERVRKEHLNWLYQEKARLEKVNDDLLEEIHKHARRETELGENLEKMMNYTHEILEIHEKMMKDYENKISGEGGIWPFLYHLFIIKKNKTLI